MLIMLIIFLGIILMTLLSSVNPVKMSFMLVLLSIIIFFNLYSMTSSPWMSMIFFMIFIGGIMIMFMILSSLLPNEKLKKSKKILSLSAFFLIVSSTFFPSQNQFQESFNQETKMIFFSNLSFEILMMVILMYFLSFVYIISKENSSLRNFLG